jgi:nitrite reductase/ring-hydroxylating ferredoxin subunit
MARHELCDADDVTVGALRSVNVGRSKIVLSKLPSGEFRAFSGKCPHQGADLSFGSIGGAAQSDMLNCLNIEREGEVLRCPWHGFEFDLRDGASVIPATEGRSLNLRLYVVTVENGKLVITT